MTTAGHTSLPLAVSLDAHVLPLPRQRNPIMTRTSTPLNSLSSASPTTYYFPLSPSVAIHTTFHSIPQVPAYHIQILAPDQTRDRIPFQQTQPSPSPERKQIRFTSSISKNPTRLPSFVYQSLDDPIQYIHLPCFSLLTPHFTINIHVTSNYI